MYELKMYKEVDCRMYLRDEIPGGDLNGLLVMAKHRVLSGDITHAVVYDENGKECGHVFKRELEGAV